MMLRATVVLALAFCFVATAGATAITAGYSGCNGLPGNCPTGSYQLSFGGTPSNYVFDYQVPNSQVKTMSYLDDVVASLEVWDTNSGNNTSSKSFSIYLLVGPFAGAEDYSTATYSLLLSASGEVTLGGYDTNNRDVIADTVLSGSDLSAFLAALKVSKGAFSVEVVDTEGTFNLGERHLGGDGVTPVRFAQLDFETPEPTSLGMAGIGLIALCWTLRKKIAR